MSQPANRFRPIRYVIAVLAGGLVGLGLYAVLGMPGSKPTATSGPTTASGKALIGGPFTLTDHRGKTRTEKDFRGRYMLVFFGYTHCPDFCPTGLQAMTEALEAMGKDADKVQPLFITIDPERDTPTLLNEYRENFHPRLVALTGTVKSVAQAAKAYRVYYAKTGNKSGDDYLVDHSTLTYLMGPDGKYLTHFRHGTPPKKVAERIRKYF